MAEELTPNLALPLPHPSNNMDEDVARLRDALTMLDAAVASKASADDLTAALAELLDSAPDALNSLRELAEALGNDPNYAATIAAQIAALQASAEAIQQELAIKADDGAVGAALAGKADAAPLRGMVYFMGQS